MASLFHPGGRKSKKQKQLQVLEWASWVQLFSDANSLQQLFNKGYKPVDVLEQYVLGFQQGGVFAAHGPAGRQQALGFLKRQGAALCQGASVDAVRKLYEVVSEQCTRPQEDGVLGSSRVQVVALDALTALLVGLRVHESDPRLLKVHVQRLYRDLDPRTPASTAGGAGAGAGGGSQQAQQAPDLHHRVAAGDCLRMIEVAFPGMLLSGGGRLLELSLAEADGATPAATQLAVTVLSHGAARYLAQQQVLSAAGIAGAPPPSHAGGTAGAPAPAPRSSSSRGTSVRTESFSTDHHHASSACTSPLAASLVATTDGYSSDGPDPHHPEAFEPGKGALHATAAAAAAAAAAAFPLPPPSPVAVAGGLGSYARSAATTASHGSSEELRPAAPSGAAAAAAPAGGAERAPGGGGGGLERVLESGGEVLLVAKADKGLRHFYVPEFYQGPGAPGLEGCQVILTLEAKARLQEAVPHFLRLLPRVVPEDLHQTASQLAPLLRVADCPPQALQPLLERHLRSNNLPLLQAVLMLLDGIPSIYQPWQDALIDQLFRIVVGRSAGPEQRAAVLSWLLRRHHQQRHAGDPRSLFEDNWSAAMPAEHDDVLLVTLKVKALAACLASGIGDPWQMLEGLSSWQGFCNASPSPQEQRALAYSLRMLCFAQCAPCIGSEHLLRAMVIATVVQFISTRPQYLPAVESFMQYCGQSLRAVLLAAVNALLAAAFPPPGPSRQTFRRRVLPQGITASRGSGSSSLGTPSSCSSGSGRGGQQAPSEHSVQHSSGSGGRSAPSESSYSMHSGEVEGEGAEGGGQGGWEDTAASQGVNSASPGSSRVPSALTTPRTLSRLKSGVSYKSGRTGKSGRGRELGGGRAEEEGGGEDGGDGGGSQHAVSEHGLAQHAQQLGQQHGQQERHHHHHGRHHHRRHNQGQSLRHRHRSCERSPGEEVLEGAHSAPVPSALCDAAAASVSGSERGEASSQRAQHAQQHLRPILTRKSAPVPGMYARMDGGKHVQAGRAGSSTAQHAQQPGQRQHEGEGGQQAQQPVDRAMRAALARSASFSALAAAAGWIKAQQWLMDAANCTLGQAPRPPDCISTWEEAESWLSDPRSWEGLTASILRHDAMRYRVLLLEIVQSPELCPLGALSFLEQYARRYVGELPGDALPPQSVGSALLAICQATVMTHLFDPSSPTISRRSSSSSGSGGRGGRRGGQGALSEEQSEVARSVQSVLGALSSAFPVAQTRHKAGAFLQHLAAATAAAEEAEGAAAPSAALLRKVLGSYLAEAIAGNGSPPS